LFSSGARQRLAALRVRKRIFDVLRFGTPIRAGYESMFPRKDKCGGAVSQMVKKVTTLKGTALFNLCNFLTL